MIPVLPSILHDSKYDDFWCWDEENPCLPRAKDGAPEELVKAIDEFRELMAQNPYSKYEKKTEAYIGILQDDENDIKTMVSAINLEEARTLVVDKFRIEFELDFDENDVVVCRFADKYK